MKENDVINLMPIEESTRGIVNDILNEDSEERIKNLVQAFNLNQYKKNAVRILKLETLLDKVSDQILERFNTRQGEFSNSDLMNYMTVVQNSIDRANKSLNKIEEMPVIQINQINVQPDTSPELDRESRAKVDNAIKAIMKRLKLEEQETQPEIIIEEKEETIKDGTTPALLNSEEE